MSGATNDILVADSDSIYLRHMRFNDRLETEASPRPHLYATSTLLDDWEHNRYYWILGTGDLSRTPVAYPWIVHSDLAVPFGLMMAFDDKTVWAVRRAGGKKAGRTEAGIYALSRPDPADESSLMPDFQKRTTDDGKVTAIHWRASLSKRARAILRAGDTVVVGGRDTEGGFIQTLSASEGVELVGKRLDASPVWDGMAVAGGRLYAALEDGTLVCFSGNGEDANR